jgi:hypothetical protein
MPPSAATLHRQGTPTAHAASPAARRSRSAVETAVAVWLAVAALGQLVFAAYVLRLYAGSALTQQMDHWNRVTPRAWLPGETAGNLVFASHVLGTVVVVLGGLLQLLPVVRRRWPALHRWNGRLYVTAALVLALGGTVMLLTRGTVGNVWQQLGTATNGLVIVVCAALAWRHARARRFEQHRRWALRLLLAVSGVWFFRIGLMAWLMIFRAPVGFDPKTFTGPLLVVLAFAQFVLPLLVLELVLRARQQPAGWLPRVAVGVLVPATALTALGTAGATLAMWWPHMR